MPEMTTARRTAFAAAALVLTLTREGGDPNAVLAFPHGEGVEGPSPERIHFGGTMPKRRD
jgi:hypothetical protein